MTTPTPLQQSSINDVSCSMSPFPSPAPSDSSIETFGGDTIKNEIDMLYETYGSLQSEGGRPSRKINEDLGSCPRTRENTTRHGECYHCYNHWQKENLYFDIELKEWRTYTKFLKKSRVPDSFTLYEQNTKRHMQELGIKWDIELNSKLQTELDRWKEYYIYWRGERIGRAKRLHVEAQEELVRLGKLPPGEAAKEVHHWYGWDGRVTSIQPALEYWSGRENDRRSRVACLEQFLERIQGEFPKIQHDLERSNGKESCWSGRLRKRPSQPQYQCQGQRKRGLSNGTERRRSKKRASPPSLSAKPTKVVKSRKRQRLQTK